MSLWRQIKQGLRVLTKRAASNREVDEEAQQFFEETVAALKSKGLSPEEARRTARLEFGSAIAIREQVREGGWENAVAGAFADCRHAARRLSRNFGLAATAVITLALGIGATTTIFTVIDHVLLRPLPYRDSGRLVELLHTAPGINLKELYMSPALYFTYREESHVFDGVSIWNGGRATVTGVAGPEEVPTLFVTHEFLKILEVQPVIGRGFTAADDDWSGVPTVLLSNSYWKSRFGGSRAVLGKRILIDGNAHEVIGVLPASFEFLDERISLVVPKRLRRENTKLIAFSERGIARLKPGVTLEQAGADVARCLPMAVSKFSSTEESSIGFTAARIGPNLRFLKTQLIGDVGKTLWVLMGAVGILLLIACANVANLLLVRADGRQRELAVRAALGASWSRIARELLIESLMLSVAGGTIGLALCFVALRVLAASSLTSLPRLGSVAVDSVTVAFALTISIGAGVLFGLIPAWKYSRPRILEVTRSGAGRSVSEGRERRRARAVLVVVQIALAVVLLVGSGLMIRTFQVLRKVNPGFTNPAQVQAIRVAIPETQVGDPARVMAMQEAILRRFEAVPGVSSVSITTAAPMDGGSNNPVFAEGHEYGRSTLPPVRAMRSVSPGFTESIGSRLIAGRDLRWDELNRAAPLALISENMARELWHSPRAALGKRIREDPRDDWYEVIGVVANLRDNGNNQPAPAIVYWPLMQKLSEGRLHTSRNVDYLIRSPRAGSNAFISELRQALAAVNPNLPLANVRTLESIYNRSLARSSFALIL